jgi:negative regulator of flagellin synthesis FlgM
MRINNGYGEIDKAALQTTKSASPAATPASKDASGSSAGQVGEKVTVSAQAQQLAAKAAADADDAKVQKLAKSLQDGSFKIDAHAIAARIVDGG